MAEQTVRILDKKSVDFLKKKKAALIKMIFISSGIDLVATIPEAAAFLPSFGGSIIAEELIETVISSTVGNMSDYDINISWLDRAKGFIPIPGITALSLKCWRELKKVNEELDLLEA